jgi:hypothetical protein
MRTGGSLRKGPLNGTVEFVLIKVRQTIVGESPYPGFRCARALRKTETSGSVVPDAITRAIRVDGDFWPHALRGGGVREVDIGIHGKVSRALTGLGVDVVYLQ